MTNQLIKGGMVLGAGRELGLSDEETIALKRSKQREAYMRRKLGEENDSYKEDAEFQATEAYERSFQKDKPQLEGDVLGVAEFGSNEADLQQASSGRIGSVQAQDQAGLGRTDKSDRAFRGARRDQLPYRVNVNLDDSFELDGQPRGFVQGEVPVGELTPEDLRIASILQDAELTDQRRGQLQYQVSKTGQKRRNFGVVQKDANGDVIKEVLNRVKRARPSGQPLNPEDIISIDKYPTARRSRERFMGNDGPEEIRKPRNASSRGQIGAGSAYEQLVSKLNTGEISIDTRVQDPGRDVGQTKTVGELLDRMLESADPQTGLRTARDEGRQVAAENYPVTKESLLRRQATRRQTEDRLIQEYAAAEAKYGRPGSTNEVIGENIMSEDSWKAKSTKPIPQLPIISKADTVSQAPVYQMVDASGNVVGHATGMQQGDNFRPIRFVGEQANRPDSSQMLNAPTQSQQSLISFISDNLQQDAKGGDFDVVVSDSTKAFTDIAGKQSPKRFGPGIGNIPPGLRSFEEADAVMRNITARGEKGNVKFSRTNPDDPKKPLRVPAGERASVSDLMSTLNVDAKTKGNLANALYMMTLAQGQGVNEAGKTAYASRQGSYQPVYRREGSGSVNLGLQRQGTPAVDLPDQNITFDSAAGRFYDGVEAQYITNSQRAQLDGKNINLQPALRNIQNPDGSPVDDASKAPFIGAVAGERTPNMPGTDTNYRFRKGFGPGVSLEQGYTDLERGMAKGKRKYSQARVDTNIALGNEIVRRTTGMNEDRANRRVMQQAESALFDENAYSQGPVGDRNRDLMIESIKTGSPLPGRRNDTRETINTLFPGSDAVTPTQPIQQAPTKASIAPDPWAEVPVASQQVESIISSKPQRFGNFEEGPVDPVLGEGRRRRRTSSFDYMSPPDTNSSRPRKQFARSGDYKTPAGPGNAQGRIDRRLSQMENIRTNPKYQTGRRVGYGGISAAVLGSMLGIGRNDEEDRQEQY